MDPINQFNIGQQFQDGCYEYQTPGGGDYHLSPGQTQYYTVSPGGSHHPPGVQQQQQWVYPGQHHPILVSPVSYGNWYQQQQGPAPPGWANPTMFSTAFDPWMQKQVDVKGFHNAQDLQEIKKLKGEILSLQTIINMQGKSSGGALGLHFQQQQQPPPPPTHNMGIRVSPPETFEGGTQEKFHNWKNGLSLYFRAFNGVTDDQKITCALSYLRGRAAESAQVYVDKVAGGQPLGTYEEFMESLGRLYGLRDREGQARIALDKLEQKGTVAEYAATFQELVSHIPNKSDADKQHEFFRGLKPHFIKELQDHIRYKGAFQKVEDLIKAAVQCEEGRIMASSMSKQAPSGPAKPANTRPMVQGQRLYQPAGQASTSNGPPRDPNAMEIDGSKSKYAHLPCFKCQEPGHIARFCKNPAKPRVFKPNYVPRQAQVKATSMGEEEVEAQVAQLKDMEEVILKELNAKHQQEFEERMTQAHKQLGF
jgi:hypothetical protein